MIWMLQIDEVALRRARGDATSPLERLIADEIAVWCGPSGIHVEGDIYRRAAGVNVWCVPVDVDIYVLAQEFGVRPADTELTELMSRVVAWLHCSGISFVDLDY